MLNSTSASLLQAASPAGAITMASEVAEVVIALAMLVLAMLGSVLFFRLNSIIREVRASAKQNLGPVSDRARSISDNVEFITQALRSDVEQLHASVGALTDRLHLASERMEERIEEFNALMEVVQGEAEELFLDTASTVRGVREGARTIAEGPRGRRATRAWPKQEVGDFDEDMARLDDDAAGLDESAADLEGDTAEDEEAAASDERTPVADRTSRP
jgi:hypothetical protein